MVPYLDFYNKYINIICMNDKIPEHIHEITVVNHDGTVESVHRRDFLPKLSTEIPELKSRKIDIQSIAQDGLLKSACLENTKRILTGKGDNVIQASIVFLHDEGLRLIEEGNYKDGLALIDHAFKQAFGTPKATLETKNMNMNINIEAQSFRDKLKMLEEMKNATNS